MKLKDWIVFPNDHYVYIFTISHSGIQFIRFTAYVVCLCRKTSFLIEEYQKLASIFWPKNELSRWGLTPSTNSRTDCENKSEA